MGRTQLYRTKTGMTFDPGRVVTVDSYVFRPFYVKRSDRLRTLLATRRVDDRTPLLAARLEGGETIARDKRQMSYHHFAQGEHNGHAWLVSF